MSAQARPGAWQIGAWTADPSTDTLTRGSEKVKIEPRMMRLLLCLAEAQGEVLSQDRLLADVWPGVIVGPASVYQSISQLRRVLGDTSTPPAYIETVARKGYRLIAPLRPPGAAGLLAQPAAAAAVAAAAVAPAAQAAHRRRLAWLSAAITVAALGVALALWLLWGGGRVIASPSIAVLPLVDMTAGKTEQPFCDGVSEELSNWLAQIPTLRVVARSSAFAFRDKATDVRAIGSALGTTHVLEGSLRRAGDHLRVNIQLVATSDAPVADALQVQERVARAVADNLELRLTDAANANLAERRSANAHAYSLYLVARHHAQQRTKEDNQRAIELYQQALAADADFALAQVYLAYAYLNQRYFDDRPINDIARQAEPLLAQAARSAPRLADLYVVRGALETELLHKDAALRDLSYASTLNPNSRDAAAELGFYYLVMGIPRQALRYYSHAAELDPLDYNLHAQRCIALADLADFGPGAAACERARALDPAAAWAYSASGAFEESRGRIAAALQWNAAALQRSSDLQELYAERARWLLHLGLTERARATYEAAVAAGDGANANESLTWVGLITLYARDGAQGMHAWIDSSGLKLTERPALLFALAEAELLAGDARAARSFSDRALAAKDLQPDELASPWLARLGYSYLLIAAAAEQASGDGAAATTKLETLSTLLQRLTDAGMRRHGVSALQAQVAALRGDPDGAMRALERAVNQGWREVWLAQRTPYFASLRGRADFRALLSRVQADNDAESKQLGAEAPVPPRT